MKHHICGESLYCILNNIDVRPLCGCGCGLPVRYISLTKGFSSFLKGHISKDSALKRGKVISKAFLSNPETHGSKTDKNFGKKVSETRKKMFENGELTSSFASDEFVRWNKGKTKETDERIAKSAKAASCTKLTFMKQRLSFADVVQRIESSNPDLNVLSDSYQNKRSIVSVSCKKCCTESSKTFEAWSITPSCPVCCPKESKAQLEIFAFVKSLGFDTVLSDREQISPLELDVWIPSKHLAIEYHGLYYHSDATKNNLPFRHDFKRQLCHEKKISLFQVFEDEWRDKRFIVESMIKHRLGFSRKIFARALELVELTSQESASFFNANHIDGKTGCQKTFGLKNENTVVCALSLRSPFKKSSQNTLEIARFATLLDHCVVGGLSRLLFYAKKYAIEQGKKTLLTYLDTRLGGYNVYESVGFEQDGETSLRFWWTDFHQRFSRQKFKAGKEKTEREVANDAGVYKIYGCKNKRFVLDLSKA